MNAPVTQRRFLDALLRTDFEYFATRVFLHLNPGATFMPNWHWQAVTYQLDLIRRAINDRLIIAMPPRSGKSIAASVAWVAFLHGLDPSLRIICTSYSQDLATKLHNDYRRILTSSWYRRLFPNTQISPRKDTETYIELTAGGTRIATSVGGTLTGLGADVLLVDDPLKAGDAYSEPAREKVNSWFSTTLMSRLNDKKNGAVVVVSQRLHAHDLIGHLLEQPRGWTVLSLPAIARENSRICLSDTLYRTFRRGELLHPVREPRSVLDRLRRDLGEATFSAQYLQQPIPPGGNLFQRDWFRRYHDITERHAGDVVLQSWDVAAKTGVLNDWSVCVTLLKRGGEFYVLDVYRARLEYPQLKRDAIRLAQRYNPRVVLVEDIGVGTALVSDLRRNNVKARGIRPVTSKVARAQAQTPKVEGGLLLLPHKAPWLAEFEAELLAFPGGRHDDQVDALCQALVYEKKRPVTTYHAIPM